MEQLSIWEENDLKEILGLIPEPILIQLQKNSLQVAKSLQNNYFFNTARLVQFLKQENQDHSLFEIKSVGNPDWSEFQDEVVTFIDGGVGQIDSNAPIPVFVRVGSYKVRTGEYDISKREEFVYYPIIFGDIEGGSKERKDFVDIVRIIGELLGSIAALQRCQDLQALSIHGPLVYMMNAYAGHAPFTEKDIDLFFSQYSNHSGDSEKIKQEFWNIWKSEGVKLTSHHEELATKKLYEPLTFIAFLYQKLIKEAKSRKRRIKPYIFGAVERNYLKEFSVFYIFEKVFKKLRTSSQDNYFNELYGRKDLNDPKNLVDRLNYTDTILLSLLMEVQEYVKPWSIDTKYCNLSKGEITLPNDSRRLDFDWSYLKPQRKQGLIFPRVNGSYIKVSETSEPIRIEVFQDLGIEQMPEAARRVYLYSQLLPGYGFPIGLDIADKYAKVPQWMTRAYAKQIQYHLGVSLQSGQITDEETRKLLIQSMYMTKRDWLFRPSV